jgi:membrane protein insertase Oxa1/YidC/SpoIIIJ
MTGHICFSNIIKNITFNVGLNLYMTVMYMMNTIQMRALNRGHSYEKFEDAKGFIRSDE